MIKKEKLFSVTKKDLKITYFSGHGAGGQHRNKHNNCVRIFHKPSEVTVISQDEKSRIRNLEIAFKRLVINEKFKSWIIAESARKSGAVDEAKERIEDSLSDEANLKIEIKKNGRWEKE